MLCDTRHCQDIILQILSLEQSKSRILEFCDRWRLFSYN